VKQTHVFLGSFIDVVVLWALADKLSFFLEWDCVRADFDDSKRAVK
jgi:hypothetical protein